MEDLLSTLFSHIACSLGNIRGSSLVKCRTHSWFKSVKFALLVALDYILRHTIYALRVLRRMSRSVILLSLCLAASGVEYERRMNSLITITDQAAAIERVTL